jgi:hypothetical protein
MTQTHAFFPSKVDAWLMAIGPVAGLAAASVALPLAWRSGAAADVAVLVVVLASTLILPIWLLLDTHYTFTADTLRVRSGPFRWRIALAEVTEVSPTRSWQSSPALSLDRLRIRYGRGRSILLSPREKQRFLEQLRQQCPAVLVTGF